MTKASEIRALDNGKRSTLEISEIVGCRPEYVRAVRQRLVSGGTSRADKNYLSSDKGRLTRAAYVAGAMARYTSLRKTCDKEKCTAVYRQVYRAARLRGATVRQAQNLASSARETMIRKTGNQNIAKRARAKARKRFNEGHGNDSYRAD